MTQHSGTEAARPVRLLVVCSANRCRSPLAGAMLVQALEHRDIPAEVLTAGFGAEGQRATRNAVAVAVAHGIDLEPHRSKRLDDELERADLVLGMERLHVRDLVVADPTVWPRAFTLKEIVRRAASVGPRPADERFADWLARVHEPRRTSDLLGASPDDDIADPSGGTLVEHEETAIEVEDLVGRLVDLAWPLRGRVEWVVP